MINDDGEELYVPMSSLRYWKLELEDAGRAPEPSGNDPSALPSISGTQAM